MIHGESIVQSSGHSVKHRLSRTRYFGGEKLELRPVEAANYGKSELRKSEDATLAGRIKLAMAAGGIHSPSELARRMKVNRQTVHNWVAGRGDKLTPDKLFRLADALNVSAKWLALGPPNQPARPVMLTPEDQEAIEIRNGLDEKAREQWLSTGRTMIRLTTKAGPGNPFGKRVKA